MSFNYIQQHRRGATSSLTAPTPGAKLMGTPKPIAPSSFADIFLVQRGYGVAPSTEVFGTAFTIFGHGISQKKGLATSKVGPRCFLRAKSTNN